MRRDTGVLQRLPGDFEQQPLLRVHRRGLARGDPEELGVELIGLPGGKEAALTVADRARNRVVLGVEGVGVPPLRRDLHDAASRRRATSPRTVRGCRPHRVTGNPSRSPRSARCRAFSAISSRAVRSSILRSASVMIARRSDGAAVIALPPVCRKVVALFHRVREARPRPRTSSGRIRSVRPVAPTIFSPAEVFDVTGIQLEPEKHPLDSG